MARMWTKIDNKKVYVTMLDHHYCNWCTKFGQTHLILCMLSINVYIYVWSVFLLLSDLKTIEVSKLHI